MRGIRQSRKDRWVNCMIGLKVLQYDFKPYLDSLIIAPLLERVRLLTVGSMRIGGMIFSSFSEVMNSRKCRVCEPQCTEFVEILDR